MLGTQHFKCGAIVSLGTKGNNTHGVSVLKMQALLTILVAANN